MQILLNLSLAVVLHTFDLNDEEKSKIQEACFRLNALQRSESLHLVQALTYFLRKIPGRTPIHLQQGG